MIMELVTRFDANRDKLAAVFAATKPEDYIDIVRATVSAITADDDYDDNNLDPVRIHIIDDGDYQGTLLFVIAAKGYQPSTYWAVAVSYGSCSGCDTLQAISDNDTRDYDDRIGATPEMVDSYMTLALHIVQRLKVIE